MTSEIIVGGLTYIDKIFANEIIATNGTFISISTGSLSASSTITGSKLVGDQLCLGARCMTAEQFNHILDMEAADVATSPTGHSGNSNSSGVAAGAPRGLSAETSSGPPIITINGDNPAAIHVGDTSADLGATITGPQADLKLGIHTFVDDIATDPVVIHTTLSGIHTIDYVVSGISGLTSTSTRTVIVSAPANDNQAATTPDVGTANDNSPLLDLPATGTDATSTAQ